MVFALFGYIWVTINMAYLCLCLFAVPIISRKNGPMATNLRYAPRIGLCEDLPSRPTKAVWESFFSAQIQ